MEIIRHQYNTPNVGKVERAASVMAGSLMGYYGLRSKSWGGAALALLGVAFVRRGVTGFCYSYQAVGVNTAGEEQGRNSSIPYELGVRVDEAITINRPRHEVYSFLAQPGKSGRIHGTRGVGAGERPGRKDPTGSPKVRAAGGWNGTPKLSTKFQAS